VQVVEPVSVAASQIIIIMQFLNDLDNTNISKTGSKWLSKSDWR
jgi:hypothetical protein